MATKPTNTVTSVKQLNVSDVVNATRNSLPENLAAMIPTLEKIGTVRDDGTVVTARDVSMGLRAIGNVMMSYVPLQNAFINGLVNRIAFTVVTSRLYENPWSLFKKGLLDYGETVEEIWAGLANPFQYHRTADANGATVFKRYENNVKVAFHSMNYQKYYPCTISTDDLRQAFLSMDGIVNLVDAIINQVYTGAEYDEFLVMKYMLARLALDGNIHAEHVPAATRANAQDVTTDIVSLSKKMRYMSSEYNMAGVKTYTDYSSLYAILTTDLTSVLDVNVVAMAFHMEKAELLGQQVEVDGFGVVDSDRLALIFQDDPYTTYTPFTDDEITELNTIQGILSDKNFFMIFDNFKTMTEIYNPTELYWNYFYHVWKTFSVSPFSNAILLTSSNVTVDGVTVTPGTVSVAKGNSQAFTAAVETTGFASKQVSWSLSGSTVSTIDADGVLTIPSTETATSITVTATSVYDSAKKGSATVTVTN